MAEIQPDSHSPALIEVHNLWKSFGELHAVAGLNLHIASGEIFGLVGPDGAGKTTTIRLLCGALRPDQTHEGPPTILKIGGYALNGQTELARAQIGYLPQRFSLYEELTVLENIRFFAEVRGLSPAEWLPRCMEILHFVGLADYTERRAGHLSGGMKQKLGLAAALVHRPRILLLDEPTTGVDPVTRQDFWQLIIRLSSGTESEHVVVLVSTPYMDEAARCTRLGFMQRGQFMIEGSPAQLCAGLEGRILEMSGQPLRLLRHIAEADSDVETCQMFGDRIHLRIRPGKRQDVQDRIEHLVQGQAGAISLIRPIAAQLEDVFMALVESKSEPDR